MFIEMEVGMKPQYKRVGSIFHTDEQRYCCHPDNMVQVAQEGAIRLSGGELYDNTREVLVCTACGAEVELMEEKVATQMQNYISHDWGMAR
jgi:hypothetical protein